MPDRSAYLDALHLLARRELSVKQLSDRLTDRGHDRGEIERAIEHLLETRELDDARVAAAYVRSAIKVKRRGRLRVQQELSEMGIARDVANLALAEGFGDVDERAQIAAAIRKKLHGKTKIATPADYARVYQFLMRQGFSPAGVSAALRAQRRGVADDAC
ncbi:MAG TPA: RecX family transcriptional regulator [Vicinamibacterales bacterium]